MNLKDLLYLISLVPVQEIWNDEKNVYEFEHVFDGHTLFCKVTYDIEHYPLARLGAILEGRVEWERQVKTEVSISDIDIEIHDDDGNDIFERQNKTTRAMIEAAIKSKINFDV